MKKLLVLLILATMIYAQDVTVTAVNNMNFGIGSEWGGDDKDVEIEKQYFEDWLDLEVFKGNFSTGLRFEAADPSSRNESLKEITRMSFNYANRGINITAGDFYGFFGRGLVFGLKESRSDFFDSKIRGGSFQYSGDLFCFKALGGKSYFKYVNDIDPADQTVEQLDNKVLGGELSLPLSTYLDMDDYYINVGGSYLYLEGEETSEDQYLYDEMFIKETGIIGTTVEVEAFGLAFFNEYALKNTKRTPSQTGWANYSSMSYAAKGFSIDLEYKDYYKYGANPNDIASGFTPYQSAPELTIVHSSHLLNTHPHVVNPNDEIGYKLTAAYQLNDRTELKAYAAFASLHNGDKIIPEFSEDYLPYNDFWFNYGFTGGDYGFVFGAGYFLDSPLAKGYNIDIIPGGDNTSDVYADQRNTFMAEYYFKAGTESKIALCGEYQTVSNSFTDEDYNDIYASVEYTYNPVGYINVSLISTTEEVSGDSPDKWLGIEAGFDIMDDHKLNLFYGRERAGIKCSGGSCRQVPEFDGFKVALVSYF